MNITIVIGTARAERKSELVYRTLTELFSKTKHAVLSVDVKDHVSQAVTVPAWGQGGANEVPTAWKKIIVETDVIIFILPEYNHGYPGEWKLLVDSLGKTDYAGKKVYLVGVSSGQFGGTRVLEHVQPVLHEIGLQLQSPALYIANVKNIFNDLGQLTDETTKERMEKFVAAVQ